MTATWDDKIYREERWVITCDYCKDSHSFDHRQQMDRAEPEHDFFRKLKEKHICRSCEEQLFDALKDIARTHLF